MARTPCSSGNSSAAAVLILVGVAIVIAAQLTAAVPITGAIALIAWGTCLSVRHRAGLLVVAAAAYAPLGVIAVMAQVDLALRSPIGWRLAAGADAGIAVLLLYRLAHQTGHILADRAFPR
ncbi:MAG: hypothetical protein DCC67_08850 [Planctomycetota bacterium]|nr:MAG: hypothetical protein DCC67_08850 [Planctomycetota bacterium]